MRLVSCIIQLFIIIAPYPVGYERVAGMGKN